MSGKSERCHRCGGYGFGCYECTPSDAIDDAENGLDGLKPIESVSLIGKHDGVLDDELFDILAALKRKGG